MSEYGTALTRAIAAAERGSISIGSEYCKLPLADYRSEGRAVLAILEDAKAVIAERDGLRQLIHQVAAGTLILQMQTAAEGIKTLESAATISQEPSPKTCSRCGAASEPVPPSDVPGPPDPPLDQHTDDKSSASFTGQHIGPRCKRKALEIKT